MVQERERTVGNRTLAGTFPRSVRVRQETVRLRVQERTISKRNSMECTTLFAEALMLMPELIEPRNIFMAVLTQIVQQNVLDEERLEFRERVRMFTEISHREEVQTTATASGLVRPVSENRNVFIYGVSLKHFILSKTSKQNMLQKLGIDAKNLASQYYC